MTVEYVPYLLTQDEAQALLAYRAFQAGKVYPRGPSGPYDGSPVGSPAILYPLTPELTLVTSSIQVTLTTIQRTLDTMAVTFDTELAQLRSDVTAQTSVITSATTFMQGFAAQLALAEQKAMNDGATAAQIADVTSVRLSLEANTAALAAAIPANTPAATGTGTAPDTTAAGAAPDTTAAGTSATQQQPAT